ncbi:MAG: ABC transporter ATP-binding protein [Desulfofustis sp.]|nr:ABC transporter ATP-binding protein [Desulfofustis sp.]
MFQVRDITAAYGSSQALFGVTLTVSNNQVVTLLGRNGMGKTTTVKSIMGLIATVAGSIEFEGIRLTGRPSHEIARRGIGLVPEGRQIFPNLTVKENLLATAANYRNVPEPYTLDDIFVIFPRLKERLKHFGNQLSGGEQQMLAVGRALMINPKLLILDEATEGLAPLVRKEIWKGLTILKSKGLSILVIDKNLDSLFSIADSHYIMEKGKTVWSGTTDDLKDNADIKSRYLGV